MPKTKKTKTRNKSTYLTIGLSEEEGYRLPAMAEVAGMTMSQCARGAIFNAEVVPIFQDTSLLRAQNLLLAQFGNNLNQLARHANRYRGGQRDAHRLDPGAGRKLARLLRTGRRGSGEAG